MLRLSSTVLAAVLILALSGCAHDYMQRTDRVAFHAGNAVRANIESQTINPSKKSMKSTAGLGKNGQVTPATDVATVP